MLGLDHRPIGLSRCSSPHVGQQAIASPHVRRTAASLAAACVPARRAEHPEPTGHLSQATGMTKRDAALERKDGTRQECSGRTSAGKPRPRKKPARPLAMELMPLLNSSWSASMYVNDLSEKSMPNIEKYRGDNFGTWAKNGSSSEKIIGKGPVSSVFRKPPKMQVAPSILVQPTQSCRMQT